jgi:hypothetical protein
MLYHTCLHTHGGCLPRPAFAPTDPLLKHKIASPLTQAL